MKSKFDTIIALHGGEIPVNAFLQTKNEIKKLDEKFTDQLKNINAVILDNPDKAVTLPLMREKIKQMEDQNLK